MRKEQLEVEEQRIRQLEQQNKQLHTHLVNQQKQLNKSMEETSFIEPKLHNINLDNTCKPSNNNEAVEMKELRTTCAKQNIPEKVEELRNIRDIFVHERQLLDDKLEELKFLSPEEEKRMVELDESIEAVDAAIEYKNDILLERAVDYTAAVGNLLLDELVHLPLAETRSLLHKYFIRVLDLRLEGRKQEVLLYHVHKRYSVVFLG